MEYIGGTVGKGDRKRAKNLTAREEKAARRLLDSEMEKGYRVCLDEAINFTQIAMARNEIPKAKYFESVTRAIYYTAWGDCERTAAAKKPVGLASTTKDLIRDIAIFKDITEEQAKTLLLEETNTMENFLKSCSNLGIKQ